MSDALSGYAVYLYRSCNGTEATATTSGTSLPALRNVLTSPAAVNKQATIQRILKSQVLQPQKLPYYLEKRDPEFELRMQELLMVYKEIALNQRGYNQVTVSVDEKPGIQTAHNIAPDLSPQAKRHPQIARDHEYKGLGTLSLPAALDLQTGHVFGQMHPRHPSSEFVSLLKELDIYYPPECTIRVISHNHSALISKETMNFLATRPNCFVYMHTPKHGLG